MDKDTFRQELETALSHIRDVVRLRGMSLARVLAPKADPEERGWELARYLLAAITRLRPPKEGEEAWPRLRYELLNLRYVNGLYPQQVADELAMSRRHFYRLLKQALDELADYLWTEAPPQPTGEPAADSLRHESARLLHTAPQSSLATILDNVLRVLAPLLSQRNIDVERCVPPDLPTLQANAELTRELLLGLLGQLLRAESVQRLTLAARRSESGVSLTIASESASAADGGLTAVDDDQQQLAQIQGLAIETLQAPEGPGYRLDFAAISQRMVLVVDDNEEIGLLFRRYLSQAGYGCVTATTGSEAIALARSRRFCAVTLDLMMNHEDGWDVLQSLRHTTETQDLPIIVCSVLDQADLAMMLGASAFIKKPIDSEQLLEALARLRCD
jgi:CheY-like chemotaxis protein/AraC-like DNA-binding protein